MVWAIGCQPEFYLIGKLFFFFPPNILFKYSLWTWLVPSAFFSVLGKVGEHRLCLRTVFLSSSSFCCSSKHVFERTEVILFLL